jgi:hypothetical protein
MLCPACHACLDRDLRAVAFTLSQGVVGPTTRLVRCHECGINNATRLRVNHGRPERCGPCYGSLAVERGSWPACDFCVLGCCKK